MNLTRFPRGLGWSLVAFVLAASTSAASSETAVDQLLPNPGFEQSFAGWLVSENNASMSTVVPAGAYEGKLGLRIIDSDTTNGSSVESTPLPAVPGHRYLVRFKVRSLQRSNSCGVYVRFRNASGKFLPNAPTTSVPSQPAPTWDQVELDALAPPEATEVSLWIHSYGSTTGSWDMDDFALVDLDATENTAPVPKKITATTAVGSTAVIPPLPQPLVPVVLKVDDLMSTREGGVPERWQRIADLAIERKIKLSIGIIANSLEGDKPAYFDWIKKLQATGLFEFWFHGYDHKAWKEGDRNVSEFQGASYEQQKDHFARSQSLAREKLGFTFKTFGSPFNVSDLSTSRVLAEDNDIKVWLYGDRANPAGKAILDRVGAVSIEQPLFVPNADKFIEGYAKNATGRTAYTIQGHPAQWDDDRWAEFVKIIDFLVQNNIPVVTPLDAVTP
jgi:hypothetical protein